jgi:hypothetical protein
MRQKQIGYGQLGPLTGRTPVRSERRGWPSRDRFGEATFVAVPFGMAVKEALIPHRKTPELAASFPVPRSIRRLIQPRQERLTLAGMNAVRDELSTLAIVPLRPDAHPIAVLLAGKLDYAGSRIAPL